MKYLSLTLITLLNLYSCSGTKQVKEDVLKKEIVQVETPKTPKIAETPKIPELPKVIETALEEKIPNTKKQDNVKATKDEVIKETSLKSQTTFNHNDWNSLLQKYVTKEGNVNYKGFKNERSKLNAYTTILSNNVPTSTWTKGEKLAYWINAYNAFTVVLIIDNYPIKSIKDIKSPWDKNFIKLGEKTFSLNDIEHKILRKMSEPRIHFGIVCASVSCPKLQNTAFEASKIEAQLTNATKEFLLDPTRNILSQNSIKISKIFKWFGSDFKQNGSIIDFLNKYSDISISQNAKKSFKDYDWNLNE